MKKILEDPGAHNVEVNKRILNVFKKKISIFNTAILVPRGCDPFGQRMSRSMALAKWIAASGDENAFKRASKSGGKALKKLVNGWKFGPNYKFKVFYNEVDVLKLKDDCDQLIADR